MNEGVLNNADPEAMNGEWRVGCNGGYARSLTITFLLKWILIRDLPRRKLEE